MPALAELWLHDNMLSRTIPSELGQATSLVNVFLDSNRLSGSLPSTLSQLSLLQSLRVFQNELTGTISSELCMMKSNGGLEYLAADCLSEMECDCCNNCY
jgi:Leucine-rich repeat (LRR) protein